MSSGDRRRARKSSRSGTQRKERAPKTAPAQTGATGVLLSINQAADEFGHDRRTITKRIAELQIQPADTRKGHPVYRLRDLLAMERTTPEGAPDPDKMSPFERQAHYKAEAERLKVDLQRGVLLKREDVEREWSRVLKIISLELSTMVDALERDLGLDPLVLERIEERIDQIRRQMHGAIVAPVEDEAPAHTEELWSGDNGASAVL